MYSLCLEDDDTYKKRTNAPHTKQFNSSTLLFRSTFPSKDLTRSHSIPNKSKMLCCLIKFWNLLEGMSKACDG